MITNLFITSYNSGIFDKLLYVVIKLITNKVNNDFIVIEPKCAIFVTSIIVLWIAKHYCLPLVRQTDIHIPMLLF